MLTLLLLPSALAQTWTVDDSGGEDFTSLQAAIDAASDGDTIEVQSGRYVGPFVWDETELTISSVEGAGATTLVGTGTGPVLNLSRLSPDSTLSGFTFDNEGGTGIVSYSSSPTLQDVVFETLGTGTEAGAAIYFSGGSPTLSEASFEDNAALNGGAIYAASGTNLSLEGCVFEDNGALDGFGGAIYAEGNATLVIDASTFYSNEAAGGGAIYVGTTASLDMATSTFDSNLASAGNGGAVLTTSTVAVTTTDTVFLANGSSAYGGAIYLGAGSTIADTRGDWSDDVALYYGGDIAAFEGYSAITIDSSTFRDSTATYGYGGAIFAQSSVTLDVKDSTFSTGYAYYGGGAIYFAYTYAPATFENVVFEGNLALYGSGGAIYSYYLSNMSFTNTTFTENSTGGQGGALYSVYYCDLDVSGASFDLNVAGVAGGAIYYDAYGAGYGGVSISDASFHGNVATYEGGAAVFGPGDEATVSRSSFTGNLAGADSFAGGLYINRQSEVEIANNLFRANAAGYGGAFYARDNAGGAGHDNWRNNLFVENTARVGGGGCLVNNGRSTVENNTWVGNAGSDVAGALCLVTNPLDLVNNIFAWTTSGTAVYAYDQDSVDGAGILYNDVYENVAGDAGGFFTGFNDPTNLLVDPGFASYVADADDSDSFVLAVGSPLIDAGDPDLIDPNGSRSDIGAMGGPEAWSVDADGDGVDRLADCDDTNAAVYPGAAETWYDGIDQDCDGNDDDQDGDGAPFAGDEADCDDEDPNVTVCKEKETKPDDVEKGCSTAPGSAGGVGIIGLAGLLVLRRRPTVH